MIQARTLQHIGPDFPTFHTHTRGTNPDIILTNYRTCHNIHIKPGPLTTSDHNPIELIISTSPILIPSTPRLNFKTANWEKFQNHVRNNLHSNNLNNENIEIIDEAVENWHQTIENAIQISIPTTYYKQLPSPKHSSTTKLLMTLYYELQAFTQQHGWTIEHYRYFKNIQTLLQESLISENNERWLNVIQNISNTCRNPAIFWDKIKTIMGNSTIEPLYLKKIQ